ncbi:ISL3 family transposase [Erysipelothrix larvae]|uniref:ISL3 family transposase n=1 Tax=Erysipelothrix larvae TaxID=1514105 RepID=UPI00098F8FB5|nr:ISL3 family transposase [Erysipelothrix larvae]
MNYTQTLTQSQELCLNHFLIPNTLRGFHNTNTTIETTRSQRDAYCMHGILEVQETDKVCSGCGKVMHINNRKPCTLRHLSIGATLMHVRFDRPQFYCVSCRNSKMQSVPFKAENHFITIELENYTRDLLSIGTYTLKQVAEITGLGKNTVKAIDLKRLKELYTIDGEVLKKPEDYTRYLGIDEFKLHDGHKYATHIIDMETGHILWIAHGKKKQVVYDFIEHVGLKWMDHVEAVACDMNSNYQEAFEEKCEHIQVVFDHFHIIKNFNDKVINEVRKDEQNRLKNEGNIEAAAALKKTRYILMSSRETLIRKDNEARNGKIIKEGSSLFNIPNITRKEGHEVRYDELLKENALIFTLDVVKEKLRYAYTLNDESKMADEISSIVEICQATKNKHFQWFGRLLDNHFEGIIAHATIKISAGKIEGINNKIKTLRRQGYGYPDDEYFFLKLIDASRKTYVRNVPSHKICD